jgi:hypothetical protein
VDRPEPERSPQRFFYLWKGKLPLGFLDGSDERRQPSARPTLRSLRRVAQEGDGWQGRQVVVTEVPVIGLLGQQP